MCAPETSKSSSLLMSFNMLKQNGGRPKACVLYEQSKGHSEATGADMLTAANKPLPKQKSVSNVFAESFDASKPDLTRRAKICCMRFSLLDSSLRIRDVFNARLADAICSALIAATSDVSSNSSCCSTYCCISFGHCILKSGPDAARRGKCCNRVVGSCFQ